MRRLFVLSIILLGCSTKDESGNARAGDPDISVTENSLGRVVYFEGDSLWNIEERMKFYGIPGASIAVIKDNNIAWAKGYGIMVRDDSSKRVTTETLFQAASISKPVSGYAVLKTVESGKINLTDDVNTWLNSWKLPDNEFTKDRKVNVADLLSHTAGITVHGFAGYDQSQPVFSFLDVLNGNAPANSAPIRVDKVPGGDFRYSGGGFCVLQQMMIDVHGKSFPEIEQELVLDPLGMTHSSFEQPIDDEKFDANCAWGYVPNGAQVRYGRHWYPELAAAGLWTTPGDLARFAIDVQKALKGESKIISKETAEKMLTKVNNGMGLSMGVDDIDGALYFGHSGWNEGFSSQMFASRNDGYGVVIMINKNKPEFITEVMMAVARTYNWKNIPTKYKPVPMDTTGFRNITGRYKNGTDGVYTVSSQGDKLFIRNLHRKNRQELVRINDSTYIPRYNDDPIVFKKSELVFTKRTKEKYPKIGDDELVPREYLVKGDFDKALKGYRKLMKDNPNDYPVLEETINREGYNFLQDGDTDFALRLFKLNTELYPKSANVYDSYADALKAKGDKKEAIANYKKALKLDPNNKETAKKLAELEA